MASERVFKDIPPFPNDVPTVPLYTIPLSGLISGDEATAKSTLTACQELGFFQLDLKGNELGEAVIKEIDQLYDAGKAIMDLPENVKKPYWNDLPKSFLGFKPRGLAETATGPDRFEWFNLGQDGLLGNTPLQPVPPLVQSNVPLFVSYLKHGQSIVEAIASALEAQLGLPPNTFRALQLPNKPSNTSIRLVKAFASPEPEDLRTSMKHHTDIGTITLLANVVGGLQILSPDRSPADESAWLWVRPRPGCLIVNLGDALVHWTGGLLRSNMHRINHSPGQQRFVDRYSIALLIRPQIDAIMRRLAGDVQDAEDDGKITAGEWEVKKLMSFARDDYKIFFTHALESNARIASELPSHLVTVFVGATSGIGEAALKEFSARGEGNRIETELKALNPDGQYQYLPCDANLIQSVDELCRQVKSKESAINLLFLSSGTMLTGFDTSESLYYPMAVTSYVLPYGVITVPNFISL